MTDNKEAQDHMKNGDALFEKGNFNEAIEEYQKTTELDPDYVDAYNNWGIALANLKKYEEAIEKYKKALEIDPDYVYAYNS